MSDQEKESYGYYLFACNCTHDNCESVFEFFGIGKEAKLEGRIAELLNKEHYPYNEKSIHVIKGKEVSFIAEKEIVREVELQV